jgi:hypothetical protein
MKHRINAAVVAIWAVAIWIGVIGAIPAHAGQLTIARAVSVSAMDPGFDWSWQ